MKEITETAVVDNITGIIGFVEEELENLGCPMKIQMQIDVVLDEIVSNICNYAYEGNEANPEEKTVNVKLDFEESSRILTITFADNGKKFNPLENRDPDIHQSIDERSIGGLGIYIVKKTMDEVDYQYSDGKNVLTVKKKI